ncbi:MAG: WecB/TagA/CpsF family glycosyltransferase [Hyphomicrobiaceae bacterium]
MQTTSVPVAFGNAAPQPHSAPLTSIEGWRITLASQRHALTRLGERMAAGQGYILTCMNLDHLVKLRTDQGLRAVYRHPKAEIMADGAPVAALARWQGAAVERSTGPDLIIPLCRKAAENGWPIFMFGTRKDVLDAGAARLREACPGLEIRGIEAPPFGYDPHSAAADAASDRMAASGARIILLGLGSPKQEIFAERAIARHPQLGFVCIGAALDFLTGEQVRAPALLRNWGLEWAWRLATSPRRLGLRYLKCALLLADIVVRRRHTA